MLWEELAFDWPGMLLVTEWRIRMMALTSAGCERTSLEAGQRSSGRYGDEFHFIKKKNNNKATHTSSRLGSVNCTNRSLSCSTPAKPDR